MMSLVPRNVGPKRGCRVDEEGFELLEEACYGLLWVTLTGSSHLASFDRRKCKGPLSGPTATDPIRCWRW
jgi:hypothetical protein